MEGFLTGIVVESSTSSRVIEIQSFIAFSQPGLFYSSEGTIDQTFLTEVSIKLDLDMSLLGWFCFSYDQTGSPSVRQMRIHQNLCQVLSCPLPVFALCEASWNEDQSIHTMDCFMYRGEGMQVVDLTLPKLKKGCTQYWPNNEECGKETIDVKLDDRVMIGLKQHAENLCMQKVEVAHTIQSLCQVNDELSKEMTELMLGIKSDVPDPVK